MRFHVTLATKLGRQPITKRLGYRLAEGITISYKSISAAVPAEEYNQLFVGYFHRYVGDVRRNFAARRWSDFV